MPITRRCVPDIYLTGERLLLLYNGLNPLFCAELASADRGPCTCDCCFCCCRVRCIREVWFEVVALVFGERVWWIES